MASALPSITGVYDVALGVRPSDVEDVIAHYQQFGFGAPSREGRLSADEAHTLYGHRAALRAVRLPHQDSDHGLLRLLIWEHPKNAGVGAGPLKAAGSRWAIALVADVWNIAHHARAAQAAAGVVRDEFDAARGMRKTWSDGMYCVMPLDGMIYSLPPGAPEALPFVDRMPHVSEMLLSRDTTGKQVLFARMDYDIPEYGKINWDSHFPCSQFAHVGLVVDGEDPSVLDFYEDTLGLMRTGSKDVAPTLLQEALMDFTPEDGGVMHTISFDDPRSSKDFRKARSGRLYTKTFKPNSHVTRRVFNLSSPGCLGMSLYSYRVSDVEAYRASVAASAATRVTPVVKDEFGLPSFSFIAPDGYWWQITERK